MAIVGIGRLPEVGVGAAVGPGGEADLLTLPGHTVFGATHEQADSYGFYVAGVNVCEVVIGHVQPAVYDVVTGVTNTDLHLHVMNIGNNFLRTITAYGFHFKRAPTGCCILFEVIAERIRFIDISRLKRFRKAVRSLGAAGRTAPRYSTLFISGRATTRVTFTGIVLDFFSTRQASCLKNNRIRAICK